MAPVVPVGVPDVLVAGDSLIFKVTYPLYPVSEGWALSFQVKGEGELITTSGEVTDDSGSTYTVNVPASRTADLAPGVYRWFALATGSGSYSGRRDVAERGVLTIEANPATAAGGDYESDEEKELAALVAAVRDSAGDLVVSYTIGNRQVTYDRRGALRRKSQLERAIWRQRNPGQPWPSISAVFSGV